MECTGVRPYQKEKRKRGDEEESVEEMEISERHSNKRK